MEKEFKHIVLQERMTTLIKIKKNTQLKEIAKIHKDPTTISKEVKLNSITLMVITIIVLSYFKFIFTFLFLSNQTQQYITHLVMLKKHQYN